MIKNPTKHPLYWLWQGMKGRCKNPNHVAWKWYGGKGVKVCDRWQTFENFVDDMGERPPNASVDRIDANKDYEPGNCRWASPKEQGRNKADITRLSIEGNIYIARELADLSGLKVDTIVARANSGLSYAEVVSPTHRGRPPSALRGILAANQRSATALFCQRGHEFTAENTDHYGNQRRCRECRLVVQRRYKEKLKAAKADA